MKYIHKEEKNALTTLAIRLGYKKLSPLVGTSSRTLKVLKGRMNEKKGCTEVTISSALHPREQN
jgi:hypothetical protein